ncbi:E3 ubiquitin-protein ligase lubel isoform X1 [Planococcus citri]|uniref:E3 ubiquitin-protein ligase lubel isoform X1 n=2 Tax=Planococcus citri TaxID=170843 RepID=UPI0031F82787
MQRRTLPKEVTKTPPLPKSEPPINDPPYEVIEFPSQQYSNTALLFGNKTAQNKKEEVKRKCDLCGSSNAQYHCEMCVQQAFCVSCDQMYHRHPKRQNHIRKRLPNAAFKGKSDGQPPIPPKGENLMAPIPPPRRNKRASKSAPSSQPETFKKNGSIMGSLKRFVGGIQPVSSPFQPKVNRNDSRPPKFSHSLHSAEFDPQTLRRDGGYLGWELQDRHRSGSFAALNGPGFSPMIQAQSMAQLNCPSCHHHSGGAGVGMSGWDWNRSQMNLNAPFQQPWPGMSTGTWHGSVMFPPAYRMPAENFSDHSSSRRGSIRQQRYNRRRQEEDSESELSLSDDRKSRRRSPVIREPSPALSRRSRRTMASDTEDDTVSRKSDRRFKRRVPMSRDPSPGVFRSAKGYRSKKLNDDDDAISVKSSCSRKSRRSPVNPHKSSHHSSYLRKKAGRSSSSDSDDELTSERDANGDKNAASDSADDQPPPPPPVTQLPSAKHVAKMSHIAKAASAQKTQVAERVKTYEKMQIKKPDSKISGKEAKSVASDDDDEGDWECEHCTYLNPESARVCDVCCKSKKPTIVESKSPTEQIVESMKALEVSSTTDASQKKKGDESIINEDKKTEAVATKTSTGTSPPPQSASTQTYDVPSLVNKRNRSLSFDDYSDWNPNKKSSSAASFTSDTNQSLSLPSKQELSPQPSQSPVFMDAVLQKQMKDSLEIVKLLKEAERHQFTPDDLTIALMHCGENNPVKWLLENWNQMIETVVTLATNFGHEQPENTIGTISSHEAKSALHLHHGDIWAAATECIRQRQRKYVKLMAQGNFTREDVVTVLTANHGDIEAAYMELRKSQLKPFLMKIWGPPQGLDNESGNTFRLHDKDQFVCEPRIHSILPKNTSNHSQNTFNFVQSWLQTVNVPNSEDNDLVDFVNLKNNLRKHASAFYLNTNPPSGNSLVSEEYSDSNDDLYSASMSKDPFLRYRSCENLNIANKRTPVVRKRFHKSSESLFYNRTRPKPESEFFLHHLAHCPINDVDHISDINLRNKLFGDLNVNELEMNEPSYQSSDSEGFEDVEISAHSLKDYQNLKPNNSDIDYQNLPAQQSASNNSSDEDRVVETDSLEGSIHHESVNSTDDRIDHVDNPTNNEKDTEEKHSPQMDIPSSDSSVKSSPHEIPSAAVLIAKQSETVVHHSFSQITNSPEMVTARITPEKAHQTAEDTKDESESISRSLFDELKALYVLAKQNLEFLIISNNDASVEVANPYFPPIQRTINEAVDAVVDPQSPSQAATSTANDPQSTKNYLSQAFIELSSPKKSLGDQVGFNDPKHDRVKEPSTSDVLQPSNEDLHSDSDDDFEDVDNKESTESNFVSGNSSENDLSFVEEREEKSMEHIDKAFNEALAEDIKEYIEREAAEINNKPEIITNRIEPVNPVVMNPPAKPIHIIRINVPDDLINTLKYDERSNVKYIQSQVASISDNHIFNEPQNEVSSSAENISSKENPVEEKSSRISSPNRALSENETSDEEYENLDEELNGYTSQESGQEGSFSEYIREVRVINKDADHIENDVSEEEKRQITHSPDEHLSDNSEDSFEVEVENCLSQGLTNYDQAVLAAQLIKLKFDRSQSLDAASECSNIQAAITYLQQDCQLCAEKVSIKQMISMLECEHRCCQTCAEQFFSLQVLEKSIVDCVCPFCKKPKISDLDSDEAMLYFSNLDILLKSILQPNVHELFQQKLRDRTLMQDPNFKWCIKCSSGFIAEPEQLRVFCPDCKSVSCAQCGKLWDKEHDGKTCEQYNSWLSKNNVSSQLSQYLEDFGVTCPKCDTKFILVKGGCMHLTCSNCKYEFCSDCMKPFTMGNDCQVSKYCAKLGLHAHHPRNCLFYLRDKEPQELKQLLKDNNVQLDLKPKENTRCDIPLQKETEDGLVDTRCGARVEEAGLCRTHFIEHLTALIRKNKLDPIVIFDLAEILQEFRRRGKSLPIRAAKMLEYEYRRYCIEVIKEEMPLE